MLDTTLVNMSILSFSHVIPQKNRSGLMRKIIFLRTGCKKMCNICVLRHNVLMESRLVLYSLNTEIINWNDPDDNKVKLKTWRYCTWTAILLFMLAWEFQSKVRHVCCNGWLSDKWVRTMYQLLRYTKIHCQVLGRERLSSYFPLLLWSTDIAGKKQ